jgi:hypothetical protein
MDVDKYMGRREYLKSWNRLHSVRILSGLAMISCPVHLIMKVLPQARIKFSQEKQSELLYKSLCVMPLKLLEQVLPWFVSKLDASNGQSFLQNMFLTGTSLFQVYCMLYVSIPHYLFKTSPNYS